MNPGTDPRRAADLAHLRERAERYRKLAKMIYNREFETKVEALARECESAASNLEEKRHSD